MAQMNYEEYLKATSSNTSTNYTNSVLPSYFSLKDDGDNAIVRFNVASLDDIKVYSEHAIRVNGKIRKVECVRNYNDSIDACPLCASGNKVSFRTHIQLIAYENENGKIVSKPYVWEQSPKFRDVLKSYIQDYGDLRNLIFKVTRNGKKGDTRTTYSLIPANPQIYNDKDYVADFSAFDKFDLSKYMLLNKSKEDLAYYVEYGDFPSNQQNNTPKTETYSKASTSTEQYVAPQPSYKNNLKDDSQPIRTVYRDSTQSPFKPVRENVEPQRTEDKPQQTPSPRRYVY